MSDTSDAVIGLLGILLGGGLLTAIKSLLNGRNERQKLSAEAEALELKTPADVTNISVTTMTAALNGARAINGDLKAQVEDLKADVAAMRSQQDRDRSQQGLDRKQQDRDRLEIRKLRRAFDASEEYITELLAWIAQHLPGVRPPQRKKLEEEADA